MNCNQFIDEGYLRKNVAKTCLTLTLPVGWIDKLQGIEGVDKSKLIDESREENYTSYVYDLWKKATSLAHRVYSHGEKDTMMFLGSYKGIKEDKAC